MKKTNVFVTAICILSTAFNSIQAQDSESNSVEKGKFIIDAYYGYPYVAGNYVKAVFSSDEFYGVESVRNMNHIGGKFEYMLTDQIGLGAEYTYASVHVDYRIERTNNQNQVETYHYRATLSKQRILARLNFHFATSKKLDPYAAIGFGYKTSRLRSNNIDDSKTVAEFNSAFANFFPVSFRLGIGMRYFITPNFGLNIEAGVGGPSIQAGITGKF